VSRLQLAEHAPRPADLQVAHRQLERRAEVGKLPDRLRRR
jgi:hypothetical protein